MVVWGRRWWPGNPEDDFLLRRWLFESTWTNQIVATNSLIYHPSVRWSHADGPLLFSVSNKQEIWHPTLSALLWLLPRTKQVPHKFRASHPEMAHRFTGLSYSQIADRVKTSEQRIIASKSSDIGYIYTEGSSVYGLVCTGAAVPTEAEFKAITVALGVQDQVRIRPIPRDRRLTASRPPNTRRRDPYKDCTSM